MENISLPEMNNWSVFDLKRSFGASRKPRLDFVLYQVKKHFLLFFLGCTTSEFTKRET